jgi:hypothetical protein
MKKKLLFVFALITSISISQTLDVDNFTENEVATYKFTYTTSQNLGGSQAIDKITLFSLNTQSSIGSFTETTSTLSDVAAFVSVKVNGIERIMNSSNFNELLTGISQYGVQLSIKNAGNIAANSEIEVVVSNVIQNVADVENSTMTWTTNLGTGEVVEEFQVQPTLGVSSLDESFNKVKLSVFPNPSKEYIHISGLDKMGSYAIYNQLGLQVQAGSVFENEQISTKELSKGIYYMNINNSSTLKFLKVDY